MPPASLSLNFYLSDRAEKQYGISSETRNSRLCDYCTYVRAGVGGADGASQPFSSSGEKPGADITTKLSHHAAALVVQQSKPGVPQPEHSWYAAIPDTPTEYCAA